METAFPSVIDGHTHLFPPSVAKDRRSYLERDAWFGELYASPHVGFVTPEEMIRSMDAAGIGRSVVCGWPWRDAGICREHNDFLAEVAQRYPDRISWLAIVNPTERGAAQEVERALNLGAAGVGEVNADAQGFAWDSPLELAELSRFCAETGISLLAHCSEPVGHRYPGKGTATPDKLLLFLEANPTLAFVAAHWGGGLAFYELMPEVAALTSNVVYDSAASTYLYQWDVFPVVERLVGANRIMLGTDYPLLKQRPFIRRVRDSGLGEDALADVLGGTARRVFGLDREKRTS